MTTATTISLRTRVWTWVKGFPKRHKIITVLVVLYVLFKIAITPIKNPFASDVYVIRGRFPFEQGFELMFRQEAYGTAHWYRRWCGGIVFKEAICSAGGEFLKPLKLDAQHYEMRLYRDRYFSWFAGWEEQTWHLQFKAKAGVDPSKLLISSYMRDENSACDGGEQSLQKFKNELFCMGQPEHKDFKVLRLTEGLPVKSNERLINFWLFVELGDMLKKGVQP